MAPIDPAAPKLVVEYLKTAQILDSTKESIASAVANKKSLGEALISDVSVSTLFPAKTTRQLQLAISLHGKQDERTSFNHRFYCNLLMDNLAAYSTVVKTANLTDTAPQITQLDFDKLLEKGSQFKSGEKFTEEVLEDLMKDKEFTNQAPAAPYAQIATADLTELLNLPKEDLDQFRIEPMQLLLNLVNTCISPNEENRLKEAYKRSAKSIVSVLSCLLIKENHNSITTVELEKNSHVSRSTNSKKTDTFFQTKTSWNKSAHNSPQRPSPVTSPLDGLPETEDKDQNQKKSPIILDDDEEQESYLEQVLRGEIPGNGNRKRLFHDTNKSTSKSARSKLSDSATKAKEKMESFAKPKFNLSTSEGTLQSIAYSSLMQTSRSAWNNADKAAKRSLQSLSRSLNGVDLNIISPQLLNILNDNLSPDTIGREVLDAISTLKQVYMGPRNTTKMNPMDAKTFNSMLKGEICNDRPVLDLKEVVGLSPLSSKPAAIPCETIKTSSGQVIHVPQNGTAGFLAQLKEFNMFLTLGWSHQIVPSLEYYYQNKSVEEAELILEEEPQRKRLRPPIRSQKSNNSSTRGNEEFLASAISKEVNRGWQIPILVSTLKKLTGAGHIKIGVATRTFLDAAGKLFEKLRMTHDCSQAQESGHSVNKLCDKDKQEKTRYGKALFRFLFNIHNTRFHYPTIPILQAKFDLDSAYQRCFARLQDALLCCTVFMGLAFILL